MLQLIGFVYGLVTLIAGKFWLGKGRKAVGTPARIAGAVLVVEPFVALGITMILMLAGVDVGRLGAMLIQIPLLIAAFIIANKIASRAANQQAMQQNAMAMAGQPAMPMMPPAFPTAPQHANPYAQGQPDPIRTQPA